MHVVERKPIGYDDHLHFSALLRDVLSGCAQSRTDGSDASEEAGLLQLMCESNQICCFRERDNDFLSISTSKSDQCELSEFDIWNLMDQALNEKFLFFILFDNVATRIQQEQDVFAFAEW